MATLDTSIPLRALQGMYNPADTMQQTMSLKDLVQQQQLRGLQIQDAMDARQRRGALKDIYAKAVNPQTGEIDYKQVRTGYAQMGDIEGLAQVEDVIGKMDDRERAQAKTRAETLAAAAQSLRGMPYEQRRAALMQMAPTLEPLGLSAEQLQGFDPTDAAIDGVVSQALGVKGLLEKQHQDRTYNLDVERFGETKRHNIVAEGVSQGQLEVAQGNLAVRRSEVARAGSDSRKLAQDEGSLRREFNALPEVKAFKDVQNSYRTIQRVANNPSAANDRALVFAYMKMLDPGSVVREGEFANAQNAAGIPEIVREAYNKAMRGTLLGPDQRQDFVRSAGDVFAVRQAEFSNIANQYRGLANDYGLSPNRVITLGTQDDNDPLGIR